MSQLELNIPITFDAAAALTINENITSKVLNVEGDLNTFKQSANSSISSLTDRMGTAESNITQTQTSIQTEVTARINGDRKYFPIQKPFYTYDGNIVTDYLNEPIRYNGGQDIYSTPVSVAAGKYILKFYSSISSVSTLESWFQLCKFGTTYPTSIGNDFTTFTITLTQGTNTIKAAGGSNLYEYLADITINDSDKGYFSVNFWADNEYIYIPDESGEFETNYSRITQTNNRITTQVSNLTGQISSIDQKADSITTQVGDISTRLDNGGFTITGNTTINGDLIATKVLTEQQGSGSIKLENGLMEVFNNSGIRQLKLGIDENGNVILIYYNSNGSILWSLGANGAYNLTSTDIVAESLVLQDYTNVNDWRSGYSYSRIEDIMADNTLLHNLFTTSTSYTKCLWLYTAARTNNTIVESGRYTWADSVSEAIDHDGKYHTNTNSGAYATGFYTTNNASMLFREIVQEPNTPQGTIDYIYNKKVVYILGGRVSEVYNIKEIHYTDSSQVTYEKEHVNS